MAKTEPNFLTPAQVVERWDGAVTIGTLANWRSRREGPPFQKFGTKVRYPLDGLAAWEAKNRHQVGEGSNDNNSGERAA